MLVFVIVNLLLVNGILARHEDKFANGWTPIARSSVFHKIRNNDFGMERAGTWKPSQSHDNSNIDYIKEEAIRIITPEQAQTTEYDKTVLAMVPASAVTNPTTAFRQIIERKDSTEPLQTQDQDLTTFPRKLHKTEMQRTPKQLRTLSATNLVSKPLDKPVINITSAESDVSISLRNISHNHYEVTESSKVEEFTQSPNDNNVGYIYQPSPVLSNSKATQNKYTDKFFELLSKYKIKPQDMLNNYGRSKLRHNQMDVLHHSFMSQLSWAPFRYNSLNHHPVDPLLAVLLSNYGYYLQGFYGPPNNYKNLYGYLASNNIHNNKPFGSYKLYSDTDSSN